MLKGGALYTYAWDRNKNIRAVLDSSSRLVAGYDYSPYGAVTATGTLENPFQWSSEFYDAELGLVYYNFRYYSPLDGRWLSRDPLGEVAGLNLYVFAHNTQAIDVLGLAAQQPCDPKSGMAGMIGGLTGEQLKSGASNCAMAMNGWAQVCTGFSRWTSYRSVMYSPCRNFWITRSFNRIAMPSPTPLRVC